MATFREGVLLATGIGIGAALSPGAWTRAAAAGSSGHVQQQQQQQQWPPTTTAAAAAAASPVLAGASTTHSLGLGPIVRERCCLVVIDVQESFIGKLPLDWREPLVERMAFLMKVAAALEIPMLATAEDMDHDGPLVPALVEQLPASAPQVFNKMIFGLASQPEILHAVEATGRDTVVLVGLETDVCIAQSALGLQQRGYRVVVVTDATASPPPHHEHGLARLRQAGVTLTSTKGLHYEWMADLATLGQVKVEQYDSFKGGSPMAATRYTL
jgi:nicotinamidase-related amidase